MQTCWTELQQARLYCAAQLQGDRRALNGISLSSELALMEVEEPSMAFTYNVMETIRNEQALQPLKAGIDRRIIMGLAAFFVFTITAFVVYVMLNINWTSQSTGPAIHHAELVRFLLMISTPGSAPWRAV